MTAPRLAAVVLAGALALTGCSSAATEIGGEAPQGPRLETLNAAEDGLIPLEDRPMLPTLVGTTLDDQPLDVSSYRGKVVVLNFWASWCPPCRKEAPVLNEVALQSKAMGVEFVGVNFKDEQAAAKAFERKAGVTYPSLFDQPGELFLRFRTIVPQQPPTTLVVDREGRIAAAFNGEVGFAELFEPVEKIAAEA